jgi:hypothetical protein
MSWLNTFFDETDFDALYSGEAERNAGIRLNKDLSANECAPTDQCQRLEFMEKSRSTVAFVQTKETLN